jgi:ketosteroid isomerase-like protein
MTHAKKTVENWRCRRYYEEGTNMKLTRLMRTTFADARSSSGTAQVEVQEPPKRKSMRIMIGILTLSIVGLLIAPIAIPKAAGGAKTAAGPTAESALAADDELTRALRDDDPDGIARRLSDDWVVISARGEVGEGKSIFPNAIRSGHLKHTAYESSEPRVRVYGNVALVTTRLHNAGSSLVGSEHKPYDAMEIQTDVWLWKDGGWKCVLTHEAWEGAEKDQKLLNR